MPLDVTQEDFLTPSQVRALKEHCRARTERGDADGRTNPVRDWAILHVALDAGLRVSEICALEVGDLILDHEQASLIVRDGKGHKKRGLRLGAALREHLAAFLTWKGGNGEAVTSRSPLFLSGRGPSPLTRSAIFRIFKANALAAGLPARFSIHSCRHTYASMLYRSSNYNIRLVQKQLGHRSIQTTQIYADVLSEDAALAVENLPQ